MTMPFRDEIEEVWQEPLWRPTHRAGSDRQDFDQAELTRQLDECLLTDEELAAGPAVWDAWEDPFHPWDE